VGTDVIPTHVEQVKSLKYLGGRPKNRWEDDVNSDITNWGDCIRNRPKWKEFVDSAKTSLKL